MAVFVEIKKSDAEKNRIIEDRRRRIIIIINFETTGTGTVPGTWYQYLLVQVPIQYAAGQVRSSDRSSAGTYGAWGK